MSDDEDELSQPYLELLDKILDASKQTCAA